MARDPFEQFLTPEQRQRRQQGQPSQPNNPPLSSLQRQAQPAPAAAQPAAAGDEDIQPPKLQTDPRTGKEIYEAFRVWFRKRERLEVRHRADGIWVYPRYFDLRDIVLRNEQASEFVLPFAAYDILVKGRNLQPLIYALSESRCFYIQDYSRDKHAPIMDNDAPFIESITISLKQPVVQPPAELKG